MMKKRRIIPFILFFVLGFTLASLVLGFRAANEKSDSVVRQYANSSLGMSGSYNDSYKTVVQEEMAEKAEMETVADTFVYSTSSKEGAANTGTLSEGAFESGEKAANDTASRKLIKTYHLSFETESFDDSKAQLEQLMSLTGAYAENVDLSVASWNHDYRSYSLTLRIPGDKTDAFLNQSSSFGTLTNRSERVEDVTLDYVDVEAHKASLQVEYDRVIELLEEAEDLEQILLLESKLSDLRYQLDSYESRLRTYDNLIDYTTVYLSIQEVHREQPKTFGERISSGFASSVENLRNACINLIVFVVSNILTIAVVIAIIWVAVFVVRKMIKLNRKNKIEIIEDEKRDM